MKKYPKISYPEDCTGLFASGTVFVQEKIDGSNGRFTLESNIEDEHSTDDRDLVFGSRNQVYKDSSSEQSSFLDCISYVRGEVDTNVLRGYDDKYDGIVLFGEYMIPNILQDEYNWEKWRDKFVGFDVWSIGRQEFLSPDKSIEIFDAIGLPYTKILGRYSSQDWLLGQTDFHDDNGDWMSDDRWCPVSNFGQGKAEGIVIKNSTTQTYGKMVRQDFREKHQTGNMTSIESGAEKLSYQYITDARIEKVARKLEKQEEYNCLEMDMMKDLTIQVIRDMVEEESQNIFLYESYQVDLSEFRSITSNRCSSVLRRLISMQSEM